jgi:hypothetical protein
MAIVSFRSVVVALLTNAALAASTQERTMSTRLFIALIADSICDSSETAICQGVKMRPNFVCKAACSACDVSFLSNIGLYTKVNTMNNTFLCCLISAANSPVRRAIARRHLKVKASFVIAAPGRVAAAKYDAHIQASYKADRIARRTAANTIRKNVKCVASDSVTASTASENTLEARANGALQSARLKNARIARKSNRFNGPYQFKLSEAKKAMDCLAALPARGPKSRKPKSTKKQRVMSFVVPMWDHITTFTTNTNIKNVAWQPFNPDPVQNLGGDDNEKRAPLFNWLKHQDTVAAAKAARAALRKQRAAEKAARLEERKRTTEKLRVERAQARVAKAKAKKAAIAAEHMHWRAAMQSYKDVQTARSRRPLPMAASQLRLDSVAGRKAHRHFGNFRYDCVVRTEGHRDLRVLVTSHEQLRVADIKRRAMVALYPTWEIRYNSTNTSVERNNRVATVADTLFKDRTWVTSGACVVVELV